jgi:hypothetical protein
MVVSGIGAAFGWAARRQGYGVAAPRTMPIIEWLHSIFALVARRPPR